MENCLLPIELCEHIIDSLYEPPSSRSSSTAGSTSTEAVRQWCQTSLVCSAWLPRSRSKLYNEVRLTSGTQVDLLIRTLKEAPHYAASVTRLVVQPDHVRVYVPFARTLLPQLCQNVTSLQLSSSIWRTCPPRLVETTFRVWSPRIMDLDIDLCEAKALPSTLSLITSLRKLRKLSLTSSRTFVPDEIPLYFSRSKRHTRISQSLRHLYLDKECALINWTPFNFGDSVIALQIDSSEGISAGTLECISKFRRLETLVVTAIPGGPVLNRVGSSGLQSYEFQSDCRIHNLRAVLSSLQPGSAVLSLAIEILPGSTNPDHVRRYGASRISYLDVILGEEIVGILSSFSALRHLKLTLWDDQPAYHKEWWQTQMVHRLPTHLYSALSVEVELHADEYLWDSWTTSDVAAERRVPP
ncbi:hypothetical protein C8Q76DRAFT_59982 [Earliella scabrosa]|nr:hypothetical protein C8Q76DRAFT_59982 [Earliella scabrosa]